VVCHQCSELEVKKQARSAGAAELSPSFVLQVRPAGSHAGVSQMWPTMWPSPSHGSHLQHVHTSMALGYCRLSCINHKPSPQV